MIKLNKIGIIDESKYKGCKVVDVKDNKSYIEL